MYIVYGSQKCPTCDSVKRMLYEAKLPYKYIDVYEDLIAQSIFKEKGLRNVPQVFFDEEYIGGFVQFVNHLRDL